jgi:mono/diheme cytochrome c family protein
MVATFSSQDAVAFVVAAIAIVLFLSALALSARGRRLRLGRGDRPDIPPAMQPGPSDPDLEKPRLEKLQGWGVALVLFFVVFVPLVWLREPSQNLEQSKQLISDSIERGALDVQLYSEANQGGIGCVRCHGDNPVLGGGHNLFNGVLVTVPNLRTVCGSTTFNHPLIHNVVDIRNTVMQGRTGTDMPSWSVRFAGALDDQQIQDIVNYIVSIQEIPFKDNVCTNIKAPDYQAPVVPAQ